MSQTHREEFWDTTRAVLMWLVILGHCIQTIGDGNYFGHPLFKGIYLFHLPVFFFISGYFALPSIRKHRAKSVLRSSVRLLAPVFSLGTIQAVIYFSQHEFSIQALFNCYICLWFLWSLFECQISGYLLTLKNNLGWQICLAAIPVLLCLIFPTCMPYADYFSFSWPFFILGMYASHTGFTRHHINKQWLWSLPCAVLAFIAYQDNWYIYLSPLRLSWESFGITIFRFYAGISAGILFLALMHQCAAQLRIAKIGTATLGIFVIQAIVFNVVPMLHPDICTNNLLILLLLSFCVWYTCYHLYLLSRRIPLVGFFLYGDRIKNI